MPSRRRILPALLPAALVLLAVAGCGGGGDAPSTAASDAAARTETVTKTVTAPATTTGTTTPSTPPDPSAPLSLQAAEQVLSGRGYTTLSERDWRPDQPLKLLIGIARNADEPRAELAFLFVGDTFIGTDTKDPSGQITVAEQGGDAVTLTYGLYAPQDSIDDPTAGTADVTYKWDGTRLVPQDPIPTASLDAAVSRR